MTASAPLACRLATGRPGHAADTAADRLEARDAFRRPARTRAPYPA